MPFTYRPLVGLLAVGLLLAACDDPQDQTVFDDPTVERDTTAAGEAEPRVAYDSPAAFFADHPEAEAVAIMRGVGEGQGMAEGFVAFRRVDDGEGLEVSVNLHGLPQGNRGFHIHETGSCEPGPDGAAAGAAGDHFAPFDRPHGGPHDPVEQRHVGDFGNLSVGSDGRAETTFTNSAIALQGAANVIGRAVIVHAGEDDLETQPTGDSGARIACGIIEGR